MSIKQLVGVLVVTVIAAAFCALATKMLTRTGPIILDPYDCVMCLTH